MDRDEKLKKIKDEVVVCKKCPLYEYRIKNHFYPVIGEGSHWAKIMFVGEAPGMEEAKTGRPFCGAAGRILDKLLEHAGIKRKDVYITNVLKDRPPGNRDPNKEEIDAYTPFLERQIDIIQPQVICTLGNYATKFIMEKYGLENEIMGISKIHGRIFETKTHPKQAAIFSRHEQNKKSNAIKIIPLYHPAVAVYNSNMEDTLKRDFEILKTLK